MRVVNINLLEFETSTLDLSTSQKLKPILLDHFISYNIQLIISGNPLGSFKLQASNSPQNPSEDEWTDVKNSVQSPSPSIMWNVSNVGYNWVRVVWTFISGSGSITMARIIVKGL